MQNPMSIDRAGSTVPELRTRTLLLERASVDRQARSVRAVLSTEAPVTRYGATEVLRHDAASVDLARAAGGLPLLWSHDRTVPIGVVEDVGLEGRKLVGTLRFGNGAKASEVLQDVADGILRHCSIGYRIEEFEAASDGALVATRWAVYEASVVTIPADTAATIGRDSGPLHQRGSRVNGSDEVINEREEIEALVRRHGLGAEYARLLQVLGVSLDQAREAVLQEIALRDAATGGHMNVNPDAHLIASRAVFMSDRAAPDREQARERMAEALAARCGGPAIGRENPYARVSVVEMARELLERHGVRTGALGAAELIERAGSHVSGDFPGLLQDTGSRILRMAYGSYNGGVRQAFRASTSRDFRAKSKLQLSEAPELLQVNEHGEFKYGAMAEAKEAYRLDTFGRIFSITRQALVNDDLDAFGDFNMRAGRASAEFESKTLVNLITGNPAMSDSVALFHASHGNLGTGASSALSSTSLAAARTAMRLQKGLDGKTPIDAPPRYLIVPAALELTAEQLLTAISAAKATDVNPFPGRLTLLVDPRLDAISATAWYLAADPATIDTVEYSYLEGEEGPQVIAREGFEIDGMQFKVRLDFGCGVLDWRGLYKANGA
jgi:HK97 family phage prohead protease